jgi:hypothetical protein
MKEWNQPSEKNAVKDGFRRGGLVKVVEACI